MNRSYLAPDGPLFTNSPPLHANPLIGSIQLLFWLFFRPSAWRSYVQHLPGTIAPDFALLQLTKAQWLHLIASPLLFTLFISPLLAILFGYILTWSLGVNGLGILDMNTASNFPLLVTASFIVSATLSAAGGIFLGWGMIISSALAGVLALILQNQTGPIFASTSGMLNEMARVWVLGVTTGIVANISIAIDAPEQSRYLLRQQVGGVIAGILVSGILLGTTLALALNLSSGEAGAVLQGVSTRFSGILAIGFSACLTLGVGFALTARLPAINFMQRASIGIVFALLIALISWLAVAIPTGYRRLPMAVFTGILFSVMYIFPFHFAQRLAGGRAGAVAGAVGSGSLYALTLRATGNESSSIFLLLALLSGGVGLTFSLWRPVALYPLTMLWNGFIYFLDRRRSPETPRLLRWHSAFWDEQQRLPLYGLDRYLVWTAAHDPALAQAAMAYLTTGFQRWAAQASRIELEARRMEQCRHVSDIAAIHKQLSADPLSGDSTPLFASFRHLSQDAQAALNQTIRYHQRLTLHEIAHRLELLSHELQRSDNVYAARFFPIALHWQRLITEQAEALARDGEKAREIDNPYIFGVPLTAQQHIFVGRIEISRRIEQQILDQRHPPLFLDGQRRMGKTSLLHNLGRLLPNAIIPLYVDGQGLAGCQNYADLLYNMVWQIRRSATQQRQLALPALERSSLASKPFPAFNDWLRQVEEILQSQNQAVGLLIFDEFEALDAILQQRGLDETVIMNLLRHLIQHRPAFRLLFASSHPLEMFDHWASYLINTQVLHLSYLQEAETRQLVERPVPGFALQYEVDAGNYVCRLTRGHPHLVQLLCYEIVNSKNEQPPQQRFLAAVSDVQTALARALKSGRFFFVDIERNQTDKEGVAVLRFLAQTAGDGPVPESHLQRQFGNRVDAILRQLAQRELIEQVDGGYQFQVEMIRHWFVGA